MSSRIWSKGVKYSAMGVLVVCGSAASAEPMLKQIGSLELKGAAAVDFDQASKRLIVGVGDDAALVNLVDPSKPEGLNRIKVFDGGMISSGVVTAVAADPSRRGLMAVAVVGNQRAASSSQVLFIKSTTGEILARAPVGFDTQDLFWMAHGGILITADAGSAAVAEDGRVIDPPGGVSVFALRKFLKADDFKSMGSLDVNTMLCDGAAYNAAAQKFVEEGGLRMRAKRVEQKRGYFDIEPRSLFVLGDNAYVSCPANNAIGVFSLPGRTWTRYIGMGTMPVVIDGNPADGVKIAGKIHAMPMPGAAVAWDEKDQVRVLAAGSGWGRGIDGPLADEATLADLARAGKLTAKAAKDVDVSDSALGQLRVSTVDGLSLGEDEGPRKIAKPVAMGSRNFIALDAPSFSVVGTSGSGLEEAIAKAAPDRFNRSGASGKADELSARQGPQVKKMVLANEPTGARALAMVESPAAVVAVDFVGQPVPRIMDTFVSTAEGQTKLSGMCFIPSYRSPNGKPLLIATFADPGTLVVYQVSEAIFKGGAAAKPDEAAPVAAPSDAMPPTGEQPTPSAPADKAPEPKPESKPEPK
ncbi:MAG: hypothetical protein KGS45_10720 [Planctomycetes bacterium]|nr:hypothetical protein [Planctomycetota bacterium]